MLKERFLHYLTAEKNYSKATVDEYDFVLTKFGEYVESQGRELDWQTINEGDLREWIVALMNRGSAASSVNTWMSALRSFYKYLLSRGLVKTDPTRRIEGPKRTKALPCFIRESQMDKLLDSTAFPQTFEGMRDHAILLTFYTTGIRLSELVSLNLSDVDPVSMTVKVTGKRNKQRIIPFGQEMKAEMQQYIAKRNEAAPDQSSTAMFLGNKGKRITKSAVQRIVKYYLGQITTQKKRSPHVLRHTFATAMLNHGANIEVVKELLGHESIATTEIYTHTTFEELKRIYKQAHPRA